MFLNLKYLQPIWILILLKFLSNAEAQVPLTRIGFLETLGNKQYFIENSLKVNWYRAVQLCNKLNMTLASIESSTEQTQLKSFLYLHSALSDGYWSSGSDLSQSGEFVWLGTGQKFTYTSWAVNPGINNARRCIYTNRNFDWLRDSCINQHYFICERPVSVPCGTTGECENVPLIIF